MEQSKGAIYKKIIKVMSEVVKVPKNGYNSFHKYNYATESDLTESIRPILQNAGLAFFSSVIEQSKDGEFTKAKMEFTLTDIETGETLTSYYWGEGQDKGDKGLYKAYTGAVKYFLMKTFLIPTGDDAEADSSVDERNHKTTTPITYKSSKEKVKVKYKTLGLREDAFESWYTEQRSKYNDNQIESYLTSKLKEKKGA